MRALQYAVDEMPNKTEKTERETMEEPIYENCKDSIERLLYVIDAADEFDRFCKDMDSFFSLDNLRICCSDAQSRF